MTRLRNDFNQQQSDPYYDLEFDRELIIQSISKQYHILPSEQENLHYSDWYRLVAGLMDDTPLGRTVQIRMEKDKDTIKNFGSSEKHIRNEWQVFKRSQREKKYVDEERQKQAIEAGKMFSDMFKNMFGK